MDIRDEIGTKGDNKIVKREAKVHLNHKYYWLHKEEDIIFKRRFGQVQVPGDPGGLRCRP